MSGRSRGKLRGGLLAWYAANRRKLPWREGRDPYRVLVSELMLQQTRVQTVVPYFAEFLRRFPTLRDLAAAPEEAVLAAWSGLGYYRRARNLQAAARRIVERHGGRFPRDARAVRELPGVGRYTAGAVRSIAFGEPEPVVDGNVARVLCRLLAIEGDPRSPGVAARLWKEAGALVDPDAPGDFNQALMELGALVCTPRSPDCPRCPWQRDCRARMDGRQEDLPSRRPRSPARLEWAAAAAVRRSGRWLLVRRPPGGLMEGLWEPPGSGGADSLAEGVLGDYGLRLAVGARLGEVRHSVLDRRIRLEVFRGRLLRPPRSTATPGTWRWVRGEEALRGALPLSGAGRKVLRLLGEGR